MLRMGEKSTVPLSNTKFPFGSRFAVRAALAMKVIFAEKFRPREAATSESSTSVKTYQTLAPFFICPRYRGIVIVPFGCVNRAGLEQLHRPHQALIGRRRRWSEV